VVAYPWGMIVEHPIKMYRGLVVGYPQGSSKSRQALRPADGAPARDERENRKAGGTNPLPEKNGQVFTSFIAGFSLSFFHRYPTDAAQQFIYFR
jgi:hypothetical protein